MNHQEFYEVLIGKTPPEIELDIEIRKREIKEMPNDVVREVCLQLMNDNKLQDFLIMAAIDRISDMNTKLIRYEISEHHRTKNIKQTKKKKFKTRKTLLDRFKTMLSVFR